MRHGEKRSREHFVLKVEVKQEKEQCQDPSKFDIDCDDIPKKSQ